MTLTHLLQTSTDIGILGLPEPSREVYLLVFGLAAIICLGSLARIRRVEDQDTRRGLAALLATSGLWAVGHVGFLAVRSGGLAIAFYEFGLIVGLSTIGAWLYFVSAYTNRTYHRQPIYRRLAVTVFLLIVAVKLTNPLHQLYFTTEFVEVPFPHLTVNNQPFHWMVMGLSYILASIGYFALFERFTKVSFDTRPLVALVSITGLPIILDILGRVSPFLIDITYEPLGVAAFAVGFVFVYLDRFDSIRVAGEHEDPVVVLDTEGRITEFNDSAESLFPGRLNKAAIGEPLHTVLPDLPNPDQPGTPIYEREEAGVSRYYRLSSNPFTAGDSSLGSMLILSEVTHRERYRRELERQNERLDAFASLVAHDLRNPLNVATGNIELAEDELTPAAPADETESDHTRGADGESTEPAEALETAVDALDRMEDIIEDVLALARQGQPIDETEAVSLSDLAGASWEMVDSREASIEVTGDLAFQADRDRLRQLLENLFRNTIDHAGTDVGVSVGPLDSEKGFFVADDGPGIPEEKRDEVLESGVTTSDSGTGFGLAIVSEIADAHGWSIEVTESEEGGARFEFFPVEQ